MDFFVFVLKMALLTLGSCAAFACVIACIGVLFFAVKGVFEFAEAYAERWTETMKRKYGLD